MNKVLVFRSHILPYSETFISEQVSHLTRWVPTVLGEVKLEHGLHLDDIEVDILTDSEEHYHYLSANRALNAFVREKIVLKAPYYRDRGYSLIHAHFAIDGLRVYPMAKEMNIPMIVTLHGYDINIYREWWEAGYGGGSMSTYPGRLIEMSNDKSVYFLAVSEEIKKRAIDFGIPSEKIMVSYIGVDCGKFKPSCVPMSERKQVVFIGRLVEKKGCEYLLSAFKAIQCKYKDIDLVVIGKGPLESKLKLFAEEQSVRVRFLGALSNDNVQAELAKSRVLCLPSITAENGDAEGLPIVILEAQASGVPVITSARGGATEGIVHNVTGYSHREKNIDEIVLFMEKILSDPALSEKMGENARKEILRTKSLDACVNRLESIYDDVIV